MRSKTLQLHQPKELRITQATPEQILEFLEAFRLLQSGKKKQPGKLISIKIDPELLHAFKLKAGQQGIPYQTKIKELMRNWL